MILDQYNVDLNKVFRSISHYKRYCYLINAYLKLKKREQKPL